MHRAPLRWVAAAAIAGTALAGCSGGQSNSQTATRASASVTSTPPATPSVKGGTFAYRFTPGIIPATETKTTGPLLTKMNAIVGIPNGTTVKPLVIVMHGTHFPCTNASPGEALVKGAPYMAWPQFCHAYLRNAVGDDALGPKGEDSPAYEAGLTYLTNALNAAGYPTLSIDVSTVGGNFLGENGDPDLQQDAVLGKHLGLIADFVKGKTHGITMPPEAARMLSSKQYFLVGHSTSGGYALHRSLLNTDPNLRGAVGLQAGLNPLEKQRPTNAVPRPTLAIYGTCDEDIVFDSDPVLAQELSAKFPTWPYAQLAVKGGTHAGTNSLLNQDAVLGEARTHPGCAAPGAILSPQNIQDGTAAQVVAFIEQVDKGDTRVSIPTATTFPTSVMTSRGLNVELVPSTMPRTSTAAPTPQAIDEQLLLPWNPTKDPVTAGDG